MGRLNRKPLQGITNIVRFNWQFYAAAIAVAILLFIAASHLSPPLQTAIQIVIWLMVAPVIVSLGVSWYVYDYSSLYDFPWLQHLAIQAHEKLVNIHAGFDETSQILHSKLPENPLQVFDFYDPKKHTEISIKRARKAYPPYPDTLATDTETIPLQAQATDYIFLIFSAHEIRDNEERVIFFGQLAKALKEKGKMVVTEHHRDWINFLAYNIGCFHFLSRHSWLQTFTQAGLVIAAEYKNTPFVTTYILQKHGTTS